MRVIRLVIFASLARLISPMTQIMIANHQSLTIVFCYCVNVLDPMVCQDGVTHNCTQLCTRNQTDDEIHHICGCEEGYKLDEALDGSCIGEYMIKNYTVK